MLLYNACINRQTDTTRNWYRYHKREKKETLTYNASAVHPKPTITCFSDSQTPLDYTDDVEITNTLTVGFDYDGY